MLRCHKVCRLPHRPAQLGFMLAFQAFKPIAFSKDRHPRPESTD